MNRCGVCGIEYGNDAEDTDKDLVLLACGSECVSRWLLAEGVDQTDVDRVLALEPGGPGINVERLSGSEMVQ